MNGNLKTTNFELFIIHKGSNKKLKGYQNVMFFEEFIILINIVN